MAIKSETGGGSAAALKRLQDQLALVFSDMAAYDPTGGPLPIDLHTTALAASSKGPGASREIVAYWLERRQGSKKPGRGAGLFAFFL